MILSTSARRGGEGKNTPSPEETPLKIDLNDQGGPANGVSRQPLTLGGPPTPLGQNAAPAPKPAKAPAPAKPAPTKLSYTGPAPGQGGQATDKHSEGDRVTGVKTFFTKLHHGSVVFMDEQIADWLKANPGVLIKQTNVCVGDVVAKKTEPNLIVMIWY